MESIKYVYPPLGTPPDTIRLLRLYPSQDSGSPLRCSIFPASLTGSPPYTALSYAWGSNSTRKHKLRIGDGSLTITANLKHALQRLRRETEELVLWVDAVCINQKDIPERNSQTANMRAIYQNAESVAVWLGTRYNKSKDALTLSRDVLTCHSGSGNMEDLLTEQKEALVALVRLLRRPYWWRIWVVQEVTCGRRSTIYCGDDEISWETLDGVCGVFKYHEDFLYKLFYKNRSHARTLISGGPKSLQISRYSPANTTPPLLELLKSHKGKSSTDPKDKVFALVGISSSRYSFGGIDYSKSMAEVYSHTARHIISTTNQLDVMCLKQHDNPEDDLPTWAPNWKRAPFSTAATLVGLHHRVPPFQASGDNAASAVFSPNGSTLTVSGFIIDTVKVTGRQFLNTSSPSNPVPPLRAFLSWWETFLDFHSDSLEDRAKFARSVSCGNWQYEDDKAYSVKLDSIFALTEVLPEEEEEEEEEKMHMTSPPSRATSYSTSRTTTMSESVALLPEDEEDDEHVYPGEKEQVAAILSASQTMNRRRLIISENGRVGLGLWTAEAGDLLCVLLGCSFPVLLRKVGGHYVLVGEVYVDGMMDGEALDGLKDGKHIVENFEIH